MALQFSAAEASGSDDEEEEPERVAAAAALVLEVLPADGARSLCLGLFSV